ncbi:unnamed protein product [Allacma fusca]|uniref:Uncharacterized protein n=1 Tax=Allacma fusca TaxID=39272 RepID=A0A8J2KIT4_9HEXA|nr:unnamed protein product [Allacma fusca]
MDTISRRRLLVNDITEKNKITYNSWALDSWVQALKDRSRSSLTDLLTYSRPAQEDETPRIFLNSSFRLFPGQNHAFHTTGLPNLLLHICDSMMEKFTDAPTNGTLITIAEGFKVLTVLLQSQFKIA